MSPYEMSPQLISKIEQIIYRNIEDIGLLAEVAEDISDPTIQALITSIIGDEYGHVRFFTSLLSSATIIPVKTEFGKKYSVNLEDNNI